MFFILLGQVKENLGKNSTWSVVWFKKCTQHEKKLSRFFSFLGDFFGQV